MTGTVKFYTEGLRDEHGTLLAHRDRSRARVCGHVRWHDGHIAHPDALDAVHVELGADNPSLLARLHRARPERVPRCRDELTCVALDRRARL